MDAQPVREHVQELLEAGISPGDIARASGVPQATIKDLLDRDFVSIAAINGEALLETSLGLVARRDPYVDIGHLGGKITSLNRAGWSQSYIAQRLGVHQTTVSLYQTGKARKLRLSKAIQLRRIISDLDGREGPNPQSGRVLEARRAGMLRNRQARNQKRRENEKAA